MEVSCLRTREITHTALSLSLVMISFILFKGSTNVFNAVIVPTVFYINYSKFSLREFFTLILLTMTAALLFFFQQLFFILFYAVLAVFLKHLLENSYHKIIKVIILSAGFLTGFYITLSLTDMILGTALRKVLASAAAGNLTLIILLYSLTAVFVAVSLLFMVPEIEKRLN